MSEQFEPLTEQHGPEAAIPTAFFVFTCIIIITASILTEIWKTRSIE